MVALSFASVLINNPSYSISNIFALVRITALFGTYRRMIGNSEAREVSRFRSMVSLSCANLVSYFPTHRTNHLTDRTLDVREGVCRVAVTWSVGESLDEAEFVSDTGEESFEEAVAIHVSYEPKTIGQPLVQRIRELLLREPCRNKRQQLIPEYRLLFGGAELAGGEVSRREVLRLSHGFSRRRNAPNIWARQRG